MRHEGEAYYVGLLKAAELHGATHQAVMEFQVVTGKRLPENTTRPKMRSLLRNENCGKKRASLSQGNS